MLQYCEQLKLHPVKTPTTIFESSHEMNVWNEGSVNVRLLSSQARYSPFGGNMAAKFQKNCELKIHLHSDVHRQMLCFLFFHVLVRCVLVKKFFFWCSHLVFSPVFVTWDLKTFHQYNLTKLIHFFFFLHLWKNFLTFFPRWTLFSQGKIYFQSAFFGHVKPHIFWRR